MYKAFGIVNSSSKNIRVEGLEDYRPIGAFSFLGRYRVIDFPISNLSNSDIDRIQIYVQEKPRTLVSHIGTGRHYNINSKSRFFSPILLREMTSIIQTSQLTMRTLNALKQCIMNMLSLHRIIWYTLLISPH